MDTDDLIERIARELYAASHYCEYDNTPTSDRSPDWPIAAKGKARQGWNTREGLDAHRGGMPAHYFTHRRLAAAVLPIVEAEVRAAKSEALREAARAILMDSFDASVADLLADAGYTEYAEDEDGGLTWVSAPLSEVLLIVRTCATEYETGDGDEHR